LTGNDEHQSGGTIRKNTRLEPSGWYCLCRVAEAYYSGQRHVATTAALVDALSTTVPFPQVATDEFTAHYTALVEATAKRLNTTKVFHYGADVRDAWIATGGAAGDPRTAVTDPLPFSRAFPTADVALPESPWGCVVPLALSINWPEQDSRRFVDGALVAKAERLGLAGAEKAHLPPPTELPALEFVKTGRHLDEALTALLTSAPLVAHDPTTATALRWLRAALENRARA